MEPGSDPPAASLSPHSSDVRLCGYLRKQKSHRRRYFVLRCASERGPARLEYYENEKKFRAGGPGSRPKKTFPLANALNINKRANARHRHLIVLYAHDGTFGVAAEDAEQQQMWYAAMVELHGKGKEAASEGVPGAMAAPGPSFKEVWQVSLRPRGLGHSRNLAGSYLLCLTEKAIRFIKLHSAVVAVVLQLLNIRRCGHSENYFFMEVGRSAATGPGELWMQVEDLVVAQNMHETILEAMKALSEDFRLRAKGQWMAASTPILVPTAAAQRQSLGGPSIPGQGSFSWRPQPEGSPSLSSLATPGQKPPGPRKPDSLSDYSALSSDEGGSSPGESRHPGTPDPLNYLVTEGELDYIAMGKLASPDHHRLTTWVSAMERNKRASLPPTPLEKGMPGLARRRKPTLRSVGASASYPEGLNLHHGPDPGYVAMLPGVTSGAEDQDYVPMTPGSVSPPRESGGYMVMSPTGSYSPDRLGRWRLASGEIRSLSSNNYMNMFPISRPGSGTPPEYGSTLAVPASATFRSLPRSYRQQPWVTPFHSGRLSCSSSTSSESLEEPLVSASSGWPHPFLLESPREVRGFLPSAPQSSKELRDYVCMELQGTAAESNGAAVPEGGGGAAAVRDPGAQLVRICAHGMLWPSSETFSETERNGALPCEAPMELGLNYIDLDLGPEGPPQMVSAPFALGAPGQAGRILTYASIDFDRSGELRGDKASSEGEES